MSFEELFHRQTKKNVRIPLHDKDWPRFWKEVTYKTYSGAAEVELDADPELAGAAPLAALLRSRSTRNNFDRSQTLSKGLIATLLKYSVGETEAIVNSPSGKQRRTYASAGGQYPIETYVYNVRPVVGLESGLYHYRPDAHALETLRCTLTQEAIEDMFVPVWTKDASLLVFLTGVFKRSTHKYGMRGYRFALLECGECMQNFTLVSEALGVGLSQIGGFDESALEHALDIDGRTESVLAVAALGRVKH